MIQNNDMNTAYIIQASNLWEQVYSPSKIKKEKKTIMWIQINLNYRETVMSVIHSLFIKSTYSSAAWKSGASKSR